jgi:2'-5' RNA ligase
MENIQITQRVKSLLLGNHASYLKELQTVNNVRIHIDDDYNVTISGVLAPRVRKMIECNLNSINRPLSHFISFPLSINRTDSDGICNYDDFKRRAMLLVPPMVIYEKSKLHLTLCVMALKDSADIPTIIKIIDKHFIDPIVINIKDLGTFESKGTIDSTSLIYAKCENNNELNDLGRRILDDLADLGLITTNGNLKWHMTVMNTLNSRDSPNKFDASSLMETMGNWDFGTIQLREMHLSKFGTYKRGSGKFYEAEYVKQVSSND